MDAKTVAHRSATERSRAFNTTMYVILKHFLEDLEQEMKYGFTNTNLKTKYNQTNGYQEVEMGQSKPQWTKAQVMSIVFRMLKASFLLTFRRNLRECKVSQSLSKIISWRVSLESSLSL